MAKRSFFLMAAVALLASLAFGTPSQATSVTVTDSFTASNGISSTITSLHFTFTNTSIVNGSVSSGASIAAYNFNPFIPALTEVTPTVTGSGDVVSISFSPAVFSAGGSVSFVTNVPLADLPSLSTYITSTYSITGGSVTSSSVSFSYSVVPEPSSMSLLGIGMASFFAFRRFFNKRTADV